MSKQYSDDHKVFADNLNYYMRKSGLRNKDLAEKLGVTTAGVSGWITGKAVPKEPSLTLLATLLGCETSDLTLSKKAKKSKGRSTFESDEVLNLLYTRPEFLELFALIKDSPKSEIEQIIRVVKALRETTSVTSLNPSTDTPATPPVQTADLTTEEELFAALDDFFARNPGSSLPKLPDRNLKVCVFVRTAFHNLFRSSYPLSEQQLAKMCDISFCRKYTTRNLALLLPDNNVAGDDNILDRYWKTPALMVESNGQSYYVFSQWYGLNNPHYNSTRIHFLRFYLDLAIGNI